MKEFVPVNIITNHVYCAEELPDSFFFNGVYYKITEISDRWFQGDRGTSYSVCDYFKVETDSGKQFILRHELKNSTWYLLF